MDQVHLIISGKVQGVFYRASCQKIAIQYDLKGWVKNLSTGQVEVLAQGKKEEIEKFINWCKKGPPHAIVNDLEIKWQPLNHDYNTFEIIY